MLRTHSKCCNSLTHKLDHSLTHSLKYPHANTNKHALTHSVNHTFTDIIVYISASLTGMRLMQLRPKILNVNKPATQIIDSKYFGLDFQLSCGKPCDQHEIAKSLRTSIPYQNKQIKMGKPIKKSVSRVKSCPRMSNDCSYRHSQYQNVHKQENKGKAGRATRNSESASVNEVTNLINELDTTGQEPMEHLEFPEANSTLNQDQERVVNAQDEELEAHAVDDDQIEALIDDTVDDGVPLDFGEYDLEELDETIQQSMKRPNIIGLMERGRGQTRAMSPRPSTSAAAAARSNLNAMRTSGLSCSESNMRKRGRELRSPTGPPMLSRPGSRLNLDRLTQDRHREYAARQTQNADQLVSNIARPRLNLNLPTTTRTTGQLGQQRPITADIWPTAASLNIVRSLSSPNFQARSSRSAAANTPPVRQQTVQTIELPADMLNAIPIAPTTPTVLEGEAVAQHVAEVMAMIQEHIRADIEISDNDYIAGVSHGEFLWMVYQHVHHNQTFVIKLKYIGSLSPDTVMMRRTAVALAMGHPFHFFVREELDRVINRLSQLHALVAGGAANDPTRCICKFILHYGAILIVCPNINVLGEVLRITERSAAERNYKTTNERPWTLIVRKYDPSMFAQSISVSTTDENVEDVGLRIAAPHLFPTAYFENWICFDLRGREQRNGRTTTRRVIAEYHVGNDIGEINRAIADAEADVLWLGSESYHIRFAADRFSNVNEPFRLILDDDVIDSMLQELHVRYAPNLGVMRSSRQATMRPHRN